MLITVFNTLSSAAKGWSLEISILDYQVNSKQFPHVIAPIAYTVSMILWIVSIGIAFTNEFESGIGYYLADFTTGATFAIAIHYTLFERYFDSKQEENQLIP